MIDYQIHAIDYRNSNCTGYSSCKQPCVSKCSKIVATSHFVRLDEKKEKPHQRHATTRGRIMQCSRSSYTPQPIQIRACKLLPSSSLSNPFK